MASGGVFSHEWARAVVRSAWRQVFGRDPSDEEAQGVQAVASLETNYGRGQGVNNWGSIHCVHCSDPNCASGTDTDASGKAYKTCFRSYPSHQTGAVDLIRTMVKPNVAKALRSGSAAKIADAMHANRYFELAPAAYASRIEGRATAIASSLGEPVYVHVKPPTNWFAVLAALGAGALLYAERKRVRTALEPAYMSLRRQVLRLERSMGKSAG